jgi:3-hydroxybutyryl-CoA dehydrogenase
MKIAVLANDHQWKEMNATGKQVDCYRIESMENITADVDAIVLLQEKLMTEFNVTSKPIFINSVCTTLKEMDAAPNVVRINGWNSFLARNTWEVAGAINESVRDALQALGKKTIEVPDEPGFVTARVIAMIINEAYFALEDNISTIEEIDIAMKLGTNYPYGPFEWATKIGADKIYTLLQKLNIQDNRYSPAPLLKAAITA